MTASRIGQWGAGYPPYNDVPVPGRLRRRRQDRHRDLAAVEGGWYSGARMTASPFNSGAPAMRRTTTSRFPATSTATGRPIRDLASLEGRWYVRNSLVRPSPFNSGVADTLRTTTSPFPAISTGTGRPTSPSGVPRKVVSGTCGSSSGSMLLQSGSLGDVP